ncbi:MAG: NAD(P)H-quinone oxidoreductase [Hyphomonas sp.]|uniref:NAD(P)H-quinone oxidoreductase n=1 Tax=Hyphomonas sp. TaxID=87 RepID=UPI00179B4DE8|nr:NAD(P)H-quinone oxidoreductase [Hyphomonas sp.]MBA3070479.1 NAD(P)H-quinone oxidoreductase [Hyphomonas sp.]MBU3920082.1 NAD(P)H-quinone oxidoreductase [Alphaproteobacteria bacterium]MBU4062009.1 NAD(P)H-quinone oxidoreductase [Alphaproteobacteria bacterium]MBU4164945.1 NAD(P)H-quinone oxidoreductase [Alphaproteobacteria bacterium]
MTDLMQAATAPAGAPLVLTAMPRPVPGPGEVQIEVAAAGLNRADLAQKAGVYPPPPGASAILGLEVSGIVSAVGPGTDRFKVGDRVAALLGGGGYATHTVADEGSVLPVPAGFDLALACCFPEAMFTVWANVFDRAGLKPGEAFLCHGATSGIGVMALQMAKVWGASPIFGTAGSEEKCALARELGATRAINYRTEAFEEIVKAEGGADVTLDMVGGDYIQKNISAAKPDGRIINIAYQDGFAASLNFGPVLMKRLSIMATTLRARPLADKRRIRDAVERDFWPHVLSGRIKPVLDGAFPLAEAEAALARMAHGGHSGKILLRP